MNNTEAVAYAIVALNNLQNSKTEVTPSSLNAEMHYLMDMYTEGEIQKKADKIF